MFMMSIIPLNKINNTIKVINKSSIICNSHAPIKRGNPFGFPLFVCIAILLSLSLRWIGQRAFSRYVTYSVHPANK